jgi:tetratricopeptide (TPR) repeat protein
MNDFDPREVSKRVTALIAKGEYRTALDLLDRLMSEQTEDHKQRVCALAPMGAIIARTIRDYGLAIRYCEMQLSFEPGNALALYALAECFFAQGKADDAMRYATLSQEANRGKSGIEANALLEMIHKKFPQLKDN